MQNLELQAENKRLKRALEEKQLMNKQRTLLKERKKLEYLHVKMMVQKIKAENEELKGVAKEVHHYACSVVLGRCAMVCRGVSYWQFILVTSNSWPTQLACYV